MARTNVDTVARGLVVGTAIGAVLLALGMCWCMGRAFGWVATLPTRLRRLDARLRAAARAERVRRLLAAADRAAYAACELLERADRLNAAARELGAFAPPIIPVAQLANVPTAVAVPEPTTVQEHAARAEAAFDALNAALGVPALEGDQSCIDTDPEIELPSEPETPVETLYVKSHGRRYRAAKPTDDGPRYRRVEGRAGKRPKYQPV